MSKRDDGGPALRKCRKCQNTFPPKPWQFRKNDFECPPCKRSRQNKVNETRDLSAIAKARYARPEVKAYYQAYHAHKRATDPSYVIKRTARRKVSTEIEAGRLVRGSCGTCGAPRADAHHHDYSRPLDIQWLCRRCHFREEHNANPIAV